MVFNFAEFLMIVNILYVLFVRALVLYNRLHNDKTKLCINTHTHTLVIKKQKQKS